MTNEEQLRRAQRAQAILGDPLVVEAFQALRTHAYDQFRNSRLGDSMTRDQAYMLHCGIEMFIEHFRALIQDGEMAAHRIEDAQREAE
jgi:hypothetical protein